MSETKYKFCGEINILPEYEEDLEEACSICIVQCMKCGWHMFGDGWWESLTVNYTKGEQIPSYCGHCGAKFVDEVEE